MRSKKKFFSLLVAAILLSFAAGVYASDGIERVEALLRPDFNIELDGLPVVLDPPPLLYEERTYLPVRAISELLGAEIDWRQSDFTVIISSPKPAIVEPGPNSGAPAAGDGGASNPLPPEPVQTGPIYEKDKIRFEQVLNYVMEYGDEEYEVLANQYRGTMFFRLRDLNRILPDYNGVRIWEEEETGQQFILFSDIRDKLEHKPQFVDFVDGPIITGTLDENQRRALFNPHRSAHYIRPLPGKPGHYEVLMSHNGEFYVRHVELVRRSGTSTGWVSQYRERIDLYKEEDD